jgi:DNA-binding transcriptional LysR family regulator
MAIEMELRHLRYFVAFADAGSLTVAAARKLHTSQPSLSRRIRDLEDEVCALVFTRNARGIEMTPAGRAFSITPAWCYRMLNLKRSGVDITPAHEADHLSMGMSLIASTRGVGLLPVYGQKFLASSLTSRPLKGDTPTVDLVLGYKSRTGLRS